MEELKATKQLKEEVETILKSMDNLHNTVELWAQAIEKENIKKIIVNEKKGEKKWVYSLK